MSGRRIREKLAAGETVFGTVLFYTTHPGVADVLPDEGLDFVMVHVEHNVLDLADYVGLRYALQSKGIACIARTHNRDPDDVSRICDTFPDGVVVPYAEDVEQLKRLSAAAKCRPLKGQALERFVREGQWPSPKSREYVERFCADTLFLPMIESPTAVENLDAICAVPGVDAVFVGPNDLTVAMGIPEQRDDPAFVQIMQRIIDTAERHGIAAGAHFSNLEHAQRTIEQGGRFIPFSSDLKLIQTGVPEFLQALGTRATRGAEQVI